MSPYELRDPIHRHILFDEFERRIIDHPFFQRLRYISQLSFVISFVYPGGVHSRFSHALGAMHVAGRLFDQLDRQGSAFAVAFADDDRATLKRIVRVAALLHDIGHGPFSHASERAFPSRGTLAIPAMWVKDGVRLDRQSTHEDFSALLISALGEEGLFDPMFAQDVASLVHAEIRPTDWLEFLDGQTPGIHAILKSLISGEVDGDRMDYLLRDSYFCGVAYGNFDLDWLIGSQGVVLQDGRMIRTVEENGVRAFESMLLARYHMIDQVYYHKTKAGFTHYLEQAILTEEVPLSIPSDPYLYADVRDGGVMESLFEAGDSPSNYWSHHLVRRIPAKRILRLHESSAEDMQTLQSLKQDCEARGVRYFTHTVDNRLSKLGGSEEAVMRVAKKTLHGIEYVPIGEYSDLLQKYNERIRFTDFFVLREDAEKFG